MQEQATPPEQQARESEPEALALREYLRLVGLGWGQYVTALESRDGDDRNELVWS